MFVQVIRGKARDPQALRRQMEQWSDDVSQGAIGFVGSTAGVTDEGEFVAVAQFESADAARRNSDRKEQGEWWAQTEKLIGNPMFADSTEVFEGLGGANPKAQFVQVMEGRVVDADLARKMLDSMDDISDVRPDVIGSVVAVHGDRFTQAVYFTDEASAREGEAKPMTDEDREMMEQFNAAIADVTYLDIRDPWHFPG